MTQIVLGPKHKRFHVLLLSICSRQQHLTNFLVRVHMHALGASMPSVKLCENLHIEIKPLQVNCEAHEALCKLVISHMMTVSLAKEKTLTIFFEILA